MWVWSTSTLLGTTAAQDTMATGAQTAGVTDLFLYLTAKTLVDRRAEVLSLVQRLNARGLRCWALEGYRGYSSDIYGPADFLRLVDLLVAFNAASDVAAAGARFAGFAAGARAWDRGRARGLSGGNDWAAPIIKQALLCLLCRQ